MYGIVNFVSKKNNSAHYLIQTNFTANRIMIRIFLMYRFEMKRFQTGIVKNGINSEHRISSYIGTSETKSGIGKGIDHICFYGVICV